MEINARQVLSGDGTVDRLADHPCEGGQLDAAKKCQEKEPVARALIWPGVGPDPPNKFDTQRGPIHFPIFKRMKIRDGFASRVGEVAGLCSRPKALRMVICCANRSWAAIWRLESGSVPTSIFGLGR